MASEEGATGAMGPVASHLGIEGYEDAAVVGRGGYAVVYRARQRSFNRTVAVKVLSVVDLDDAALRRFDRERAAIGTLSGHPNIVTVYDSGFTAAGSPYLAMEYLARGSLADQLSQSGPRRWQDVLALGVRLAGALETAHRMGVLHRDIKPENVLMSNFGEPKLADFGIAHVVGGPETRSGSIELSVLHAPPEVVDGKTASNASDVYGLASTLFTLVHGRPPFFHEDDESLIPLLLRIATAPLPELSDAPPSVRDVFEQAMAKDPSVRHGSALELAHALRAEQERAGLPSTSIPLESDDEPDPEPAPPSPSPAVTDPATRPRPRTSPLTTKPPEPVPPRRRPRWLAAVGGVAVVLAVGAGLVVALREGSSTPSATPPPVTTAPPPATTAPAVGDRAFPVEPAALTPGSYRPTVFEPDLRLRIGPGWELASKETPDALELGRLDAPDGGLGMYLVDQVVDPTWTPASGRTLARAATPVPASVTDWLKSVPGVTVDATGASKAGQVGSFVDFHVDRGYTYGVGGCAHTECVLLFRNAARGNPIAAYAGYKNRCYVFPTSKGMLLLDVGAPAGQYDRFLAATTDLLSGSVILHA